MKKIILKTSLFTAFALVLIQSCTKKLDLKPTNDTTSETVYSTPAGYKQVLAKVYGSFALTGNRGPAGPPPPPHPPPTKTPPPQKTPPQTTPPTPTHPHPHPQNKKKN